MARPLPVVRAGAWYHVVNRGVDRTPLMPRPEAAARFVTDLGKIAECFSVEIHAYCTMGNHYHLLARGEEAELLRAVAQLERGIPGRPGERPRLCRMALGRHLLQVTRYIHRNPVEAGLVERPADWPWSSYRAYLDPADAPRWLRSGAVLGWLGSIGARQRYRRYVESVDINMSTRYDLTYEDDGATR